jgi:transposase
MSGKGLSQELRDALEPLFGEIESLNERITEYDRRIEQIAKEVYPEVGLLKQVKGMGTLIALTFVLTLDDRTGFGAVATWVFYRVASWGRNSIGG